MPITQPIGKKTFIPGQLILNSPYEGPSSFWSYDRKIRMFERKPGRRPAGYIKATPGSVAFDDPGVFVELALVNQLRPFIQSWREAGFPGVTGITRRLLEHWRDPEERRDRRFFFCQLEAIETIIWLSEVEPIHRAGIQIPGDGGAFSRFCSKMATGSGKTIVMAMLAAWQILNKVTYPEDGRFSKNIFVVAPGLTVKNRLQVLLPDSPGNYYDEFNIVPAGLVEMMRIGQIRIRNWHVLNWDSEERLAKRRSVDKRGALSDEAYVREVLGEMAQARDLLIINDEAHHAWRVPSESNALGLSRTELEEATKWIGGLDRIHKSRGILGCYDFTATPFVPSGKKSAEEALFGWVVSDFGLNDAIESGLVKTPRVVVRDDGRLTKEYKSRLYHIYADSEVKDDLQRKAEDHEPLPDLVVNAYTLLGKDWLEAEKSWKEMGHKVPPVMISVANRTETAARIKYALDHGKIRIDELCDPERTLHIDSKVLDMAEAKEEAIPLNGHAADSDEAESDEAAPVTGKKLNRQEQAEKLRQMVDTVGQYGKPGGQIQKVISVGMLSEGWDAKTVTHIMGLRAFSSQLLCEQVVGRGLRRTSYDVNPDTGLFDAEYVNIFGIPFTFLPHEGGEDGPPPPPPPKTRIEPLAEKIAFEITWPNILRIDHVYHPLLSLDVTKAKVLEIDASEFITRADLGPILEGKPDVTRLSQIDLEALGRKFRMQKIVFETARDIYDQMKPGWKGNKEILLSQIIRLVEAFLASDKIRIKPDLFHEDEMRRRIALTLAMNKVVQHIWEAIRFENTASLKAVFDQAKPIRSTRDVRPWYTGRPCEVTERSHISHCVFDSTWEASEAWELDRSPNVAAWVKNDHLGFEILYVYKGVIQKYRPDFLIRLMDGSMVVLEVKGQDTQQDQTKREFLNEWVRAVNQHGGFGKWAWEVVHDLGEIQGLVQRILSDCRYS
jgi:type III restriction enzyme